MTRISLVDAYDNRDVIVQIENLKKGKQDKLNAGTGVTIEGNTINVDTSDLATKGELTSETARLDQKIDDVDAKIPPLASKEELNAQTARLDQKIDDVDNKIPPLASKAELTDEVARLDAEIEVVDAKIPPLASKAELASESARLDARVDAVDAKIPPLASKAELTDEVSRLDTRIDDVDAKIPPLASKAELTAETTRLDAKIERGDQDLSSRIDASNVKIKTNADAIHNIEDELGSDALPGTIYYRISKVEGDVITLKPLVNDSIKKVDVEGDASTVYHKALHNSGIVENDAIPVASDTKAGVMSASMYVGFNSSIQNLQARMAVVEGVGVTYQLTGLPDNATSEQITAAFREQYPNVPLMAGIRAADYDKAKIWQYSGTSWIQLTSININTATSTSLGVVMGSVTSDTNDGKIFVEVDGSMTVIGWDTLKALATAAKQSVDNLEPKVTQQSAKIDALEDNVAANASDITTLETTVANHESRISSLETTSASLGTRMSTAETDIDNLQSSDAQQTTKISSLETTSANQGKKISSLETTSTDLGTRMSSAETDIDNLQASDAQQTSKISALETTSADLGTRMSSAEHDIETLQASDTQQTSKITSLETTTTNLGTRMGTAEHDIDTLQASDAQHTTKISALEADMNNVKPRVGQLESDVGALETKVDQHTQSISGLSTEVNGLKTSKQDKLIAGSGITIASDGKTISSAGPSYRIIKGIDDAGREAIFNEFKNFLANAKMGDEFAVYRYGSAHLGSNYESEMATYPSSSPIFQFGDNYVYMKMRPVSPIRLVGDYSKELIGVKLRTFCYRGDCLSKGFNTNSDKKNAGTVYFTLNYNGASGSLQNINVVVYPNTMSYNQSPVYDYDIRTATVSLLDRVSYCAVVNYS